MTGSMLRRVPLHIVMLAVFCAVIVPATAVVAGANYLLARSSAVEAAGALLDEVNRTVSAQVSALVEPPTLAARVVPLFPTIATIGPSRDHPILGQLRGYLDQMPNVTSMYVGYANGDFLRVVNLAERFAVARQAAGAVPGTMWGEQVILEGTGTRREFWRYLDGDGTVIGEREVAPNFDPSQRPWYRSAIAIEGLAATPPYVFANSREVGITLAHRVDARPGAVVGVDMTLDVISDFLSGLRKQWHYPVELAIFDANERVVATSVALPAIGGPDLVPAASLSDAGLVAAINEFARRGGPYPRVTLTTGREQVVAAVQRMPLHLGDNWVHLAIAAPMSAFVAPLLRAALQSVAIAFVIALLAVPLIVLFSALLARPLRRIADESDRIRHFDVDGTFQLTSRIREVADLAASTSAMKATLSAFAKYVPRDLVRGILESNINPMPGGERRPVTLLFTDIEGFTTLSEQIPPEALMHKMSDYLERMVTQILSFQGTVDKYVGDAIMAYWNAPKTQPLHVVEGCRAALRCRAVSNAMNEEWRRAGEAPLYTRFGLHTGDCIVGNMGSTDRLDFTVLGATVNLASRLEGLNKHYGTQVMVSQTVRENAGPDFVFRPVDLVLPKGAVTPIPIHELLGVREGSAEAKLLPEAVVTAADIVRCSEWESIYSLVLSQDWRRLIPAVGDFLKRYPADKVATLYLKRAWLNAFSGTESGRDGVERFQTK